MLITVVVASFGLVALGACKAACAAGPGTLRAEDDDTTTWQEFLEEGQKQQAGPLKPGNAEKNGGVNARGNGGVPACPGKTGGKGSDNKTGKNSSMFGANGTQVIFSKTVASGKAGQTPWRIDVENPAPGKRPGSLHVQLDNVKGATRYEYAGGGKFKTKDGDPLPRKVQQDIDDSPDAKDGILRGLDYLKEKW